MTTGLGSDLDQTWIRLGSELDHIRNLDGITRITPETCTRSAASQQKLGHDHPDHFRITSGSLPDHFRTTSGSLCDFSGGMLPETTGTRNWGGLPLPRTPLYKASNMFIRIKAGERNGAQPLRRNADYSVATDQNINTIH